MEVGGYALYKCPIQIEFQGTYRQIGEFLTRVGKLENLLTVETLKISRLEKIIPKLKASLTLNAYKLLSQ
jgi:Tfp pilus assembly protein PilO